MQNFYKNNGNELEILKKEFQFLHDYNPIELTTYRCLGHQKNILSLNI